MSASLPEDEVARFLARCRAEWAEAGLPPHITDETTLDMIAAIVVDSTITQK